MKKCLACSLKTTDDAQPTCLNCGEASWSKTWTPKPDAVATPSTPPKKAN